ncbi:MAG: response regulator [Gammaproteobacteria bacterium]
MTADYKLFIVDDEPDIHTLTQLSLKSLRYRGRSLAFLSASSGQACVLTMRTDPDVAVILLDVVMEDAHAGLEACRAIREELGNRFVRILLCTGQPGVAPERETLDKYDIDGYLPKAELTSNRLYAAVRTALKAWEEIIELDRHRRALTTVHDCMLSLHSFEPLQTTLNKILCAAVALCPTDLAILHLETFETKGNPEIYSLHLTTDPDAVHAEIAVDDLTARLRRNPMVQSSRQAIFAETGYVIPVMLHRELGFGWIYLQETRPDALTSQIIPLLAAHAANALYSAVAQAMLARREGPLYEAMIV